MRSGRSGAADFPREGIRYAEFFDGEKTQWDALEWTEEGTIPDAVEAARRCAGRLAGFSHTRPAGARV